MGIKGASSGLKIVFLIFSFFTFLAPLRLRASPGFGLAVPPALHRIFTACGIRDASATIEGSRNPMNTLKAALQILHGGAAMPGFGDGTGKKGARGNKGVGMRSREEIEAERGRWGVEVGRRL